MSGKLSEELRGKILNRHVDRIAALEAEVERLRHLVERQVEFNERQFELSDVDRITTEVYLDANMREVLAKEQSGLEEELDNMPRTLLDEY